MAVTVLVNSNSGGSRQRGRIVIRVRVCAREPCEGERGLFEGSSLYGTLLGYALKMKL